MELPPLFLSRMQSLLGEEYPAFLAGYEAPPVSGLRINTLKLSPQEFRQISPYPLAPVPWSGAGFILPPEVPGKPTPGKHPYHAAGLYYLQDPSAMAPAEVLTPQPGERVIDLAAAPGGKATHLAALLQGQGFLVANEVHPHRAWDLAENIERWGASNVAIINETPERLADHFGAFFDRVLLDAPCSGEGLFRKTPAARREWSLALVEACAARQDGLLSQAARLVRPGGRLVYSTCTFAPQENEGTIARFLARNPDFAPSPIPLWIGADPSTAVASGAEKGVLHLYPHHIPGEGHFVALLQRIANDSASLLLPHPTRPSRPSASLLQALRFYHDFVGAALTPAHTKLVPDTFSLHGTYLYAVPQGLPSLEGIKIIHPGLWLGVQKKDRFEPSHALALSLQPAAAQRVLGLHPDSPDVQAYLRGETLPAGNLAGGDGWVLVTLCGADGSPRFPLGWGKRSGTLVKNFYPKGLRQF